MCDTFDGILIPVSKVVDRVYLERSTDNVQLQQSRRPSSDHRSDGDD